MLKNQEFNSIGKNSELNGKFIFMGPTHILGSIKGEIEMQSSDLLTLLMGSSIEGTVKCTNIEIYGDYIGEIHATGKVTLFSTANFDGKILANHIEILPGAVVNMQGHAE